MAQTGDDMTARDASMTVDEFKLYYQSHRGVVSSVRAYDTTENQWVSMEDLFSKPGAYTLIVVKFKNNTFLRINVKPTLTVRMDTKSYASPATWKGKGIDLTFEEKSFLETLNGDLSLEEILSAVSASSFEGKDGLVKKLKKATDR
jgi:hypothetical protein